MLNFKLNYFNVDKINKIVNYVYIKNKINEKNDNFTQIFKQTYMHHTNKEMINYIFNKLLEINEK